MYTQYALAVYIIHLNHIAYSNFLKRLHCCSCFSSAHFYNFDTDIFPGIDEYVRDIQRPPSPIDFSACFLCQRKKNGNCKFYWLLEIKLKYYSFFFVTKGGSFRYEYLQEYLSKVIYCFGWKQYICLMVMNLPYPFTDLFY